MIQPIVLRPVEDGFYEIIAGKRRYRAAAVVFGVDCAMPIVVQDGSSALSHWCERQSGPGRSEVR
ncbi:MAG: ParB N-terminal domain-containing protein [Pseudomonadales bacterium]